MVEQPSLQTERLLLRPFVLADAADVQRLAGEREIAAFTTNIPHPYEDGVAEQWIGTHQEAFEQGRAAHWAIVLRDRGLLIGAIGLSIQREHARAEMGYWIGRPYWGRGYCTEAARAVLRYGFTVLGLNRIYAAHMRSNPASGRVMQKIGMRYEGRLRQHVLKWGVFEDLEVYSILKGESEAFELAARGIGCIIGAGGEGSSAGER